MIKQVLYITVIILSLLGVIIFSCQKDLNQKTNQDVILVNMVLDGTKQKNEYKEQLVLSTDANNQYTISVIDSLFSLKNDKFKLGELKQSLGIKNDTIVRQIFLTENEHNYFLSQQVKALKWDKTLVDNSLVELKNEESIDTLQIGKPVYNSKKELALVCFKKSTSMGILVFVKEDKTWKEKALIAPLLIQPKVKEFNLE